MKTKAPGERRDGGKQIARAKVVHSNATKKKSPGKGST